MDFAARAALLKEFTGLRARAAEAAVASATAALVPLARAAEAAQRRFSGAASNQSGANTREWSFKHEQGRVSQECSLVELFALGEVAPGLVINSCEQNLSLRLVDALGGAGKLWELYQEGRRARREFCSAEKSVEEAQRALKQATVHDEAARKCCDLVTHSGEVWETRGRHITSREVQQLVHQQGLPSSTTLHGAGCGTKTAKEVILALEASARAAQNVILACPGYKEIVSLDPSDPDICCWGWTVDGTRHGPYSLKDLRCWVQMGSIQSDGLISHSSQPDRYANIHEVLFYLELQALAFWMDLGLGRAAQCTGKAYLPNKGYKNGEPLDRFFDPMDFINSLPKPKAAQPHNSTKHNHARSQELARRQNPGSALASQTSIVTLIDTSSEPKGPNARWSWKEKPKRKLQEVEQKNVYKNRVRVPKSQVLENSRNSIARPRKTVVLSLFRAAEQGANRIPSINQGRKWKEVLRSEKVDDSVPIDSVEEADHTQNGVRKHESIVLDQSRSRKHLTSSGESDEMVTYHGNKHKLLRGQEASGTVSHHLDDDPDEAFDHMSRRQKQPIVNVPSSTEIKVKRSILGAVKATNIVVSKLERPTSKQSEPKKVHQKPVLQQRPEPRRSLQHISKKRKVSMESKAASDLEARSLRSLHCSFSKTGTTYENSSSILVNESAGHAQSSSHQLHAKTEVTESLHKTQQMSQNTVRTGKHKNKSYGSREDVSQSNPCMYAAPLKSTSVAVRTSCESSARGTDVIQEKQHQQRECAVHKSKSHWELVKFKRGKQKEQTQEVSPKNVENFRQKIQKRCHSEFAQDGCLDGASVSLEARSGEKASQTYSSGESLPEERDCFRGCRSGDISTQLCKDDQVCQGKTQMSPHGSDVSDGKKRSCHNSLITKSHTSLPEEPSEATRSDPQACGQSTTGWTGEKKGKRGHSGEDSIAGKNVEDLHSPEVHERIHMLISDLRTPSFAATPPASPQQCDDLVRINKVLFDLQTPVVSGSLAGTPDPIAENGKPVPSCTQSVQDKGSARGASDLSELGVRTIEKTVHPSECQDDAKKERKESDNPQAKVEELGVLTKVLLESRTDCSPEGCVDEEQDCGSLSDVPLAKRRVLLTGEDSREKPKEVKRRVKQANRKRVPIVTTRPSRPGPKTKRAIRYATPSTTPSLQTIQSMHNGCSNSRTLTAETVKRKSTPDDGISVDCGDICARNLIFASIIRRKRQQRAEAVQDTAHDKSRDLQSARGDVRNRALRIESRQVVRSDIADASKWKNTVARGQSLRLGRSCVHAWGLYATEKIEPETFVIEYTGQVIRKVVSELREKQYEADGLGSSYLFRLDDEYVVDATKRGGLARFINHSCDPNCYTKIITVDGQKKIGIYSRRSIVDGEELFYDYKFDYEEEGKRVRCHCGARNCRGFMN